MTAIAIDDEPVALDVIRNLSAKVPFLELSATFTDAFKALDYLQQNAADLIFLDIKMPDISGIEFYSHLTQKPLVIFTTAYSDYAVASFELDAVDYLLKPFSLARFMKACSKANEIFQWRNQHKANDFMFLKTGYEQVKIRYEDILYMEAEGNYISFVCTDQKYLSRMTFAELENLLPSHMFIRVHRSYMVSIRHIDRLDRYQLHIRGQHIPVGENYLKNLSLLGKSNHGR